MNRPVLIGQLVSKDLLLNEILFFEIINWLYFIIDQRIVNKIAFRNIGKPTLLIERSVLTREIKAFEGIAWYQG